MEPVVSPGQPAPFSVQEAVAGEHRLDPEVVTAARTALVDRDTLEARLAEAEETLRAIRGGEVDAIVVTDRSAAERVLMLSGTDRPYRIFVENVRDGAATISEAGRVLFANQRLAQLLCLSVEELIGALFVSFVADRDLKRFRATTDETGEGRTIEVGVRGNDGKTVPTSIRLFHLQGETEHLTCITVTDLRSQRAQERKIRRLATVERLHLAALQTAVSDLTEQATHDALTGLPNRVLLIDRLEQTLLRAERTGTHTAVMFVDLDHFKEINDTSGHTAGDIVLCLVAAALRGVVRSLDTVARFGGDEFVIVCPDLHGYADAAEVSRRIVADIGRIADSCEHAAGLTASVGVSVVAGGPMSAERMLREADTAMYDAKSRGRNRVESFDTAHDREGDDHCHSAASRRKRSPG
jgi:diguanylate cyclase (GGDEF)-like protein/PAS domain S-box-containing protein